MTTDDKKSTTAVEQGKDPDALRAEIDEIRADLGDTVEALAAKADVKAQAQAKVEQGRRLVARYGPWPQVAAGAAAVVAVAIFSGRAVRRRRNATTTRRTLRRFTPRR